jgi:hypothetical protein
MHNIPSGSARNLNTLRKPFLRPASPLLPMCIANNWVAGQDCCPGLSVPKAGTNGGWIDHASVACHPQLCGCAVSAVRRGINEGGRRSTLEQAAFRAHHGAGGQHRASDTTIKSRTGATGKSCSGADFSGIGAGATKSRAANRIGRRRHHMQQRPARHFSLLLAGPAHRQRPAVQP